MKSGRKEKILLNNRTVERCGIHRSRVAVIHPARGRGLYFPRRNSSPPLQAVCSCEENIKKLERLASDMAKLALASGRSRDKARTVDIFLLGDAEMRRLKKKFLPREKGPANVLSFAEPAGWPHPEGGAEKLGEVYLNTDLTGREMDRMAPLLLHGVLHLLGYDHKKKSDRIKMEKLEKEILKRLVNS